MISHGLNCEMIQVYQRLHILQSETRLAEILTKDNLKPRFTFSHLIMLTVTDYFSHTIFNEWGGRHWICFKATRLTVTCGKSVLFTGCQTKDYKICICCRFAWLVWNQNYMSEYTGTCSRWITLKKIKLIIIVRNGLVQSRHPRFTFSHLILLTVTDYFSHTIFNESGGRHWICFKANTIQLQLKSQ
jgi:hypothetical protein